MQLNRSVLTNKYAKTNRIKIETSVWKRYDKRSEKLLISFLAVIYCHFGVKTDAEYCIC
jgi:hypothetical protein